MEKLKLYLLEAFKNVRKSILISVLIVVFLTYVLMFFGMISKSVNMKTMQLETTEAAAYLQYGQYNLCVLDDFQYAYYEMPGEAEAKKAAELYDDADRIIRELEAMQNEDFGVISVTGATRTFSDVKKGSYTDDAADEDRINRSKDAYIQMFGETFGVENTSSLSTLLVNDSFFTYEYLPMAEGRNLTAEDLGYEYLCTEENPIPEIPILVGYHFLGSYHVGDTLQGWLPEDSSKRYKREDENSQTAYYDQFIAAFRIVGILAEDTTVSSFSGTDILNLNDTVILPCKENNYENYGVVYTDEDKVLRLGNNKLTELSSRKMYIAREKADEIKAKIYGIINSSKFRDEYSFKDTEYVNNLMLSVYEQKTDSLTSVAGLIAAFVLAGLIMTLINKFSDNAHDYAIHRLIGSSDGDLVLFGVFETLIYLLCADILAHYPYVVRMISGRFGFFGEGNIFVLNPYIYGVFLAVNLLVLLISVGCNLGCLRRGGFVELIKGKE